MSDYLRFKRAVVFVFLVQKVEWRLNRHSNESLPWLERVVSPFFSGELGKEALSVFLCPFCQLVGPALVMVDSLLVNRTPSHVTSSRVSPHSFRYRT